MIITRGYIWLDFPEPHFQSQVPQCVSVIAGLLAIGWRIPKDGAPNYGDFIIGPKHLQDFKHASKASLRRQVSVKFFTETRLVEGDFMRVEQCAQRLGADRDLLRTAQNLPNYRTFWEQLVRILPEHVPSLLASEPEAHSRVVIAPAFGADPAAVKSFARGYEHGFSAAGHK